MAEYINKWTVVDMLTDLENQLQQHKPFRDAEREMYRKICETEIAIGKTQAADVVEVVRCRDCKFGETPYGDEHDGWIECSNIHGRPLFGCNDFCSYGERKDGDGNGA